MIKAEELEPWLFDMSRKNDHIYCIEFGMNKSKVNEYNVYKKMIKYLEENYTNNSISIFKTKKGMLLILIIIISMIVFYFI